jgi:uroporphyrin-III C-methyltransferase
MDTFAPVGFSSARSVHHPVSIVGAGPGDAELLTVRAFSRIARADLVLRDLLVPDSLLAATGTLAEIVDVGRRCGSGESQAVRQARINGLMLKAYRGGRRVVRLKSGDPLVFGRAAEEARFLFANDVPFELVPGITAGIAAANLVQIPLTERHRSPSVLFCTGQAADGDAVTAEAWAALLRGGTTLVLYMGLAALAQIVPRLGALAPADAIHVTAVSQVSTPEQRHVTGRLSEIEALLAADPLAQPVVFLLGLNAVPIEGLAEVAAQVAGGIP